MTTKDFRSEFAARFGEDNAARIEAAGEQHLSSRLFDHVRGKGSDAFRWAVLMAISFECLQKFAASHEFTCAGDDVFAWLRESDQRSWLAAHDGDIDAIALLAGAYNSFMPEKAEESAA